MGQARIENNFILLFVLLEFLRTYCLSSDVFEPTQTDSVHMAGCISNVQIHRAELIQSLHYRYCSTVKPTILLKLHRRLNLQILKVAKASA